MEKRVSVIIPNYNSACTIGACLEAVYNSDYKNFEVIVVDDHSEDNSTDIINRFPCKLICLETRSGTSRARNTGAQNSSGEILFFIDSDCLLQSNTLDLVNSACNNADSGTVIGGTYTKLPYDRGFFSIFQSVWINYSETKKVDNPDYIAAHAMIISAESFNKSGGFPEVFLPIIEDIEFSHRLKRSGLRLIIHPEIEVRHIFGFSLFVSLSNAFRKTKYWCIYSLKNRDMFADSGTASIELKFNVFSFFVMIFLLALWVITREPGLIYIMPLIFLLNAYLSRRLFKTFYHTKGIVFAVLAFLYYTCGYPLPIGLGTAAAIKNSMFNKGRF